MSNKLLPVALVLSLSLAGCSVRDDPPSATAGTAGVEAEAAVVAEARAFMAAYGEDLAAGRRAAISDRYDRRGVYFLGNGRKNLRPWAQIEQRYRTGWQPPASFEWKELSFEPAGRDAVVVAGLFVWGLGEGKGTETFSYTGLLVRQDGVLRIRLEDESGEEQGE